LIRYLIQYVLPGLALLVLAFFAGSHSNIVFALIGFLSFFSVAVFLVVEGYKKTFRNKKDQT